MIVTKSPRSTAGGRWIKSELRITDRFWLGFGIVTCMKGVPHPLWHFSQRAAFSPQGIPGEATTISLWRIRCGWWRAMK